MWCAEMVLPEDGVGLPEGAAMDWAHLQNVRSSYAVRLQREVRRKVLVEKEEHDNVDERARVLHEVNRFTSNRNFRTDVARRLVTGEFRRPNAAIGTMILEPKLDALAPFALDRATLLKACGEDRELSPRATSGKKEALRKTVLMRRAEMARDFPHVLEWKPGVAAADTASSDDMSSEEDGDCSGIVAADTASSHELPCEEDAECSSGAVESPQPNLPSGNSTNLTDLEEPTSPPLDEKSADDEAEEQWAPSILLPPSTPEKEAANVAFCSSPRPTTHGEQTSPKFATPTERPLTVPLRSVAVELGSMLSPAAPAVLSPWHLDSLANRSRKGLSTQLSVECLPIVMGMNDATTTKFMPSPPTPPRAVENSNQGADSNRSPAGARRRVSGLQRMSQLQLRQQDEYKGGLPQNSAERWVSPSRANSLADSSSHTTTGVANVRTEGFLHNITTQDLPLQFSGMDMLAAARSSSRSGSSRSSCVTHGTQSRPPISPRHLVISAVGVSVSARPSVRCKVSSRTNRDRHGVHLEASLSSLVSQSSRKWAQTHRFSATGSTLNQELSQSSFARIQKRGGMAKTAPDRRGAFGGGFSTGPCARLSDTDVSIRKGRPPAVTPGFEKTVSLHSG